MIEKLSVVIRGGIEVYSYISPNNERLKDSQLLSGIFYAIQSISEEIKDPVSYIRLQNSIIYIKTFSDFSILLTFANYIKDNIIEETFIEIAKLVLVFFDKIENFKYPKQFVDGIQKIINVFSHDEDIINKNKFNLDKFLVKNRIAITGLGKAGKTSIKKMFFDNWDTEKIQKINPTIGIEYTNNLVNFINESVIALDFGGQKIYRDEALSDQRNWSNLSSLVFVVDMQQPDYFKESKDYLDRIFLNLKKSKSGIPFISIFMHKYDEDCRDKIDLNLNQFFITFDEYIDKFSFYISSIYDKTCVEAMLKTIYFSLPNIMIKQIFERLVINKIENELLDEKLNVSIKSMSKNQLIQFGLSIGQNLSKEFQNQWLNYYIGNINPSPRGILSKQMLYKVDKHQIKIGIENWESNGIQSEISDSFVTGVIKGVLNTLFLKNDLSLISEKVRTTWFIELK